MGGMTGVLMWVLGAACTQRTVYDQQVVEPHLMDDAIHKSTKNK